MRHHTSTGTEVLSGTGEATASLPLAVSAGGSVLLIRNGVPEQYLPSGAHIPVLDRDHVEVRVLPPQALRKPLTAPPDAQALALPYERSYLNVDGVLVGMVKPGHGTAPQATSPIGAWEGDGHATDLSVYDREELKACLDAPLRACLPASGHCCGGRGTVRLAS